MKEYIEREALKRDLIDNKNFYPAIVKHSLENISAADVKEVVHAEWVKKEDSISYWYECSNCGERPLKSRFGQDVHSPFCPECGAQMDGVYLSKDEYEELVEYKNMYEVLE